MKGSFGQLRRFIRLWVAERESGVCFPPKRHVFEVRKNPNVIEQNKLQIRVQRPQKHPSMVKKKTIHNFFL